MSEHKANEARIARETFEAKERARREQERRQERAMLLALIAAPMFGPGCDFGTIINRARRLLEEAERQEGVARPIPHQEQET